MRLTTFPLHLVSFAVNFSTSNNFVSGLFTSVEAPLSLVFRLLMQFLFSSVFRPAVPWQPLLCFFFWFAIFMPSLQFPS